MSNVVKKKVATKVAAKITKNDTKYHNLRLKPLKIAQNITSIEEIENRWRPEGVILYVFEQEDVVILDSLIVPPEKRKQGIGSQIMQEVVNYANSVGKRLELSPGQKDD